nr:GNAT family N-acetyltransferase [Legionella spiritensis]
MFVVEDDNQIVGVAQIDYLQYLTYKGGVRAQIEGVRIQKKYRNKGIGKRLFNFLLDKAKQRGCQLVQLTTDKSRPEALKFYESLGFVPSHIGMKLHFKKNERVENKFNE